MKVLYNEIEPSAILWLQAAMDADIITKGVIDTRSIEDVRPDELIGYDRCHFFAGIGGWEIAVKIAEFRGWKQQGTLWTGSCPCQPFSTAGKGAGVTDPRHLWPAWFWLIQQCKPGVVFGEQVANAVTKGWMDDVAHDLESEDYAVGSSIIPACSVGAPHKRDRLWFVADSTSKQQQGNSGATLRMEQGGQALRHEDWQAGAVVARPDSEVFLADASEPRLEGRRRFEQEHGAQGWKDQNGHIGEIDLQWLSCPDGKARPVKSGVCLLADGIPGKLRKAALHGYGNAIHPEVAAEFILASSLCQKS